jgi:hypothetical protein
VPVVELAAVLGAGREPRGGRGGFGLPGRVLLAFSLFRVVVAGIAVWQPGGLPGGVGGFQLLNRLGGQTVAADLSGDLPPGRTENDFFARDVFGEAPAFTVAVQPPVGPICLGPEIAAAVRVVDEAG